MCMAEAVVWKPKHNVELASVGKQNFTSKDEVVSAHIQVHSLKTDAGGIRAIGSSVKPVFDLKRKKPMLTNKVGELVLLAHSPF
ncbi:hypothetical protein PTKIN_Ptkin14bG0114700 [Pterospermum kingtungense]